MHVLLLVAGTNDPSNCDTLADAFADGVRSAGAEAGILRLKDFPLDHFTVAHYAPGAAQEPAFRELQSRLQAADAFAIAAPVWNFSVPAHLKNFIDRIGSFALDATKTEGALGGKPFYCIFTGGAPRVAWTGMMRVTTSHVPEAFKYFGATPLGHHYEPRCVRGKGMFDLVVSERPESLEALRAKGARFVSMVRSYRETGKLPLRTRLALLAFGFGRRIVDWLTRYE